MVRQSERDLRAAAPYIAATRFGLGMGPDDLDAMDGRPRAWLAAQTEGPASGAASRADDPDWAAVRSQLKKIRGSRRKLDEQRRKADTAADRARISDETNELITYFTNQGRAAERAAFYRLAREAVTTFEPFKERLVHFWTNHFAARATNRSAKLLLPFYQSQAIRPFVTGRFVDMLLAAESHPLMLMFLDNDRSVGPNSPEGRRRKRGMNENLAREILELHTVGVAGGYDQTDVGEFAKALTGWSVALRATDPEWAYGDFVFRADAHEPGPVAVMGKTYSAVGREQAETVLRDLAADPSTARYLAYKLAQHFIADDPLADDVEALAGVYLETDGDLGEVYRALITRDGPWRAPLGKLKQPWDYVFSSLRVLGTEPDESAIEKVAGPLIRMGQPAFRPPGPQGWYDRSDEWADPSSLLARVQWARHVARGAAVDVDPMEAADRTLGTLLGEHTYEAVRAAPNRRDALALLIASPEFQRR